MGEPAPMPPDLPRATHTGEMTISGIRLRVYVLSDGQRLIDADDLEALFNAWGDGASMSEDETLALARFIRGSGHAA